VSIVDLKRKPKAKVLGIDCSTKSFAFAIFDDKKPVRAGEVFFKGGNVFERLNDAHNKIPAMIEAGVLEAEYVAMEGAILVGNNARTGISLAYVYGAVIGGIMRAGLPVVTVAPLTWQTWIGNPNLKPAEKAEIKKANPGRSASWYQNAGREMRKQRTLAFARQHFTIPTNSDNVGDAVGIAWYASHNQEIL
jgi:Holliday junction resolvasome RuvABC endonuclease subunit